MEQHELLKYTVDAFDQLCIPYMIVGSVASITYGERRMTDDIDIACEIRHFDVPMLMRSFPSPKFYVSPIAIDDAIRHNHMFNIMRRRLLSNSTSQSPRHHPIGPSK
jgi:hypothetical protein